MKSCPNKPQEGFILPVVIVLLAILMTVIVAIVEVTDRQRQTLIIQRQQLQAQQELLATEALLKYLLAVAPLNKRGLNTEVYSPLKVYQEDKATGRELLLDGRFYQGVGQAIFSLQDQSGLAPLNYVDDELHLLDQLLQQQGLNLTQRQQLIDTLGDYIDEDNLKRLNGAETKEYQRLGLAAPANRPLQSPQELANVFAWRDSGVLTADFLTKVTLIKGGAYVNVNTSPALLLSFYPKISPELAKRIVAGRPWSSVETLNERLGVALPVDSFKGLLVYPGTVIRLHIQHPQLPWGHDILLQLKRDHGVTPEKIQDYGKAWFSQLELTPWRIKYVLDYPVDRTVAAPPVQQTQLKIFSTTYLSPATTDTHTK